MVFLANIATYKDFLDFVGAINEKMRRMYPSVRPKDIKAFTRIRKDFNMSAKTIRDTIEIELGYNLDWYEDCPQALTLGPVAVKSINAAVGFIEGKLFYFQTPDCK